MRHHRERERWEDTWAAAPNPSDSPQRAQARKRLQSRRGFQRQVVGVVVVNAVLVAIWAASSRGYFWPAWAMAISVVVLILRHWDTTRRPISEADVDAEVERDHSGRP